jgi:hypothetical protein
MGLIRDLGGTDNVAAVGHTRQGDDMKRRSTETGDTGMGMVKRMKDLTEGMEAHRGTTAPPIAGVSLELYAQISKGLAAYNYDVAKGPVAAAARGVSADQWECAMTGWNERIKADRSVAHRFNAFYTGRA